MPFRRWNLNAPARTFSMVSSAALFFGLVAGTALAQDAPVEPAPAAETPPPAPAEPAEPATPAPDPGPATDANAPPPTGILPPPGSDTSPKVPAPMANFVGVVVGLSSYESLPDEVELDFARSDAAIVAKALREDARFSEVFLLTDGEAKRDALNELLRTTVAQLVGPDDVLILYMVGHGVGADLDLPVIMAHDSTLENGQEDGWELQSLARDLQTWTPAGTYLIVTDVIHRNQLDGIFFYGPAANDWPRMSRGTMIISASQSQKAGVDGAFGSLFANGIGGGADANRDKMVTASELFTYLMNNLSPTGQIPVATGDFDTNMVVSRGQRLPDPEPVADAPKPDDNVETVVVVKPPEPRVIYPDYTIGAAKFVWKTGDAHTVQCRAAELTGCDMNCYVRNFKAGPCQLTAIYDNVLLKGEVVILMQGKYECSRVNDELSCKGP